jgi:hypothetical protein
MGPTSGRQQQMLRQQQRGRLWLAALATLQHQLMSRYVDTHKYRTMRHLQERGVFQDLKKR